MKAPGSQNSKHKERKMEIRSIPRQHVKKWRHHFADKGPSSQSYDFFPLVMYRCES